MYLKHISHTDSSVDTLATDIEIAATWCTHIRGLMFRREFSVGSALVFQFDRVTQRTIHMLFVYSDIDVLWLKDDIVKKCTRLSAWYGIGTAEGDTVIELPSGVAGAISTGDTVRIVADD
jgi:Uncharacterized conserved protein